MKQEEANSRLVSEITSVGELTRMVAQRYDGMFSDFYSLLLETLKHSADMAEAARVAMELADAAVDAVRSNFAGQPKYACGKGCSACCHLFVAVPPGVAEVIAWHVNRNFTDAERENLVERLKMAETAAIASGGPQALRTPCALLNEEGACTIYDVRPLSCRSFTSTSLPRCEQVVFGVNPQGGGVDQNPARYRLYESATRALEVTARERGLPSQQRGLSAALLAELGC
ncbi:YkgJ family cysteine cluster protein [Rhizobium tumorigenes]|uniref:YkgJ family cysteine cluster protein n=1 Tax=Rhizobium tumorigenes TaxID=2041385 RepID=A0AAF1K845_9HYPH|nr:YkgJ family cysteine cluster protein [Rhizobium tumorigenes]WFR95704.1 YkgJ family cysteine cluster protein [Rhizobium tumorigenes]